MANFDASRWFAKICRDMREAQHEKGCVPTIAPQYTSFKPPWDVFNDSPEWGSAVVLNPWHAYQRYGDRRILADNYDAMARYVAYLEGRDRAPSGREARQQRLVLPPSPHVEHAPQHDRCEQDHRCEPARDQRRQPHLVQPIAVRDVLHYLLAAAEDFDETGHQYMGLIMADHAKCSINTMFNTGTVVGVGSNLYGSGFHDRFVPAFAWGEPGAYVPFRLDKFLRIAEVVMPRRHQVLTPAQREMLTTLHARVHGGAHMG